MSLSQDTILSFLLQHGGKVSNSELLNNFRSLILRGDSAERQHNRDEFKRLVNSVAVVQQLDGMKFVVVKKKYQDFAPKVSAHDRPRTAGRDPGLSHACPRRAESTAAIRPESHNNNNSTGRRAKATADHCPSRRTRSLNESRTDTTTVKVLNIPRDRTSSVRRSGPVFAVIAVQSPPRGPAAAGTHGPPPHGPQIGTLQSKQSERGRVPDCDYSAKGKDSESKAHCLSNKHTLGAASVQVRPPNKSTRHEDAVHCESVPLDSLAHEWLVKCAAGLWGQIHALLLQDAGLARRKDFMSGFTALHWAAKDGNSEVVHKIINISRRKGVHVDVNSKAHGGYTPLHIAAIHQHSEVMVVLVQSYGARVAERDHSGKKAFHYLSEGVSVEVRALLGGAQLKQINRELDDESKEQTKSFHIGKLFQPHTGKRQKTKFAQDW